MHLRKRALILTILLIFIASTGAVAVSAQTSSPTTAADANASSSATALSVSPLQPSMPSSVLADIAALGVNPLQSPSSVSSVSATAFKNPTTLMCLAPSQSVRLTDKYPMIHGVLLNGSRCMPGQTVKLYSKVVGSSVWTLRKTGTTNYVGWAGWWMPNTRAQVVQYKLVYAGTNAYAPAVSNIVSVKYEKTPTKPYQTYLWAVAPKAVTKHGTYASFKARLYNGSVGIGGKTVTVWKLNSQTQKWVAYKTLNTLTGVSAGVILLTPGSATATTMVLKVTFAGASPYAASESNTVQLIWT